MGGSSAGTIDTLDALDLPPLPTGEKKQENEDDQRRPNPIPAKTRIWTA